MAREREIIIKEIEMNDDNGQQQLEHEAQEYAESQAVTFSDEEINENYDLKN